MKLSLTVLFAAATYVSAGSTKIPEGGVCYVKWQGNKYMTDGTACDTGLDCVYQVADDGVTELAVEGMCEQEACMGSNKGTPPGEGTSRVTICHRTCSEKNPWVRITIDEDGWDGAATWS